MPGMTKKKRTGAKPEQKTDERAPHHMVRVGDAHYKKMKALAKRHERPVVKEVKLALEDYMKKHGIEPPPKPPEDED
jgi:hypothetical protein